MELLTTAVQDIIGGEFNDSMFEDWGAVSFVESQAVAQAKTGSLPAMACRLGGLAAGSDWRRTEHLAEVDAEMPAAAADLVHQERADPAGERTQFFAAQPAKPLQVRCGAEYTDCRDNRFVRRRGSPNRGEFQHKERRLFPYGDCPYLQTRCGA